MLLQSGMAKPHVLVVDDDELTAEGLRTYLEVQGYRVSEAHNCAQALERLRGQEKIDIVILDYLMPDGPGTDLLRSVGDQDGVQRPPVIMASSILDPNTPLWLRLLQHLPANSQSMIQAYVTKPYAADGMDMALHEVLGGDYKPEPRTQSPSEKSKSKR